jgi:hypothetical protein
MPNPDTGPRGLVDGQGILTEVDRERHRNRITRVAEAIRAARGSWVGGGDGDFDRHLAVAALVASDAEETP